MEHSHLLPFQRSKVMRLYDSIKSSMKLLCLKIPSRVLLVFLLSTGFFNTFVIRSSFSIAIVEMTANKTFKDSDGHLLIKKEFSWNSKETGVLLSTFFWGNITTQIIGAILTVVLGGKMIFGLGIFIPALLSLVSPLCMFIDGYWLILILRVLQGAFAGGVYTAMISLLSKWTPSLERSVMMTIVNAGGYVGMGGGMLISGEIVNFFGWQGIFYWFGVLGIVWYFFWLLLATDIPETNKYISAVELDYIQATRQTTSALFIELKSIPLCKILRSAPVWGLGIAMFVGDWGTYTMLTELPRYLIEIYKVNVKTAGILSGISYFSMTFFVIINGFLIDYLRNHELLETTKLRKVWVTVGFGGRAIFVLALIFIHDLYLSVVFLCFALSMGSVAHSAYGPNNIELNPNYSAMIMAITNTLNVASGIISPIACGYLTTSGTRIEWNNVFVLSILIDVCGTFIYVLIGSSKLQSWDSLE